MKTTSIEKLFKSVDKLDGQPLDIRIHVDRRELHMSTSVTIGGEKHALSFKTDRDNPANNMDTIGQVLDRLHQTLHGTMIRKTRRTLGDELANGMKTT